MGADASRRRPHRTLVWGGSPAPIVICYCQDLSGWLAQSLAAHVLVGPVLAFEGPVLLVVAEVSLRAQRVHDGLRQQALRQRIDLDLERLLASEHGLDAPQPSAVQEPRQAPIESHEGVL